MLQKILVGDTQQILVGDTQRAITKDRTTAKTGHPRLTRTVETESRTTESCSAGTIPFPKKSIVCRILGAKDELT